MATATAWRACRGEPLQTKYPVAFPWLLSLVWRLDPQFPANLGVALWIVRLSGAAFLAGAFVLLRQLGFAALPSLVMTAVCALHPIFLHLSGLLLSDVPFMAVGVWSLVSAQRGLESQNGSRTAGGCSPWVWRPWRPCCGRLALRCLPESPSPLCGGGNGPQRRRRLLCVWPAMGATASAGLASNTIHLSSDGYGQTIQFYKSYIAFWKLSTPDWQTFFALLTFNFRELVKEPAVMAFILPASGFSGFGWQLGAVALSFTVVRGLFRVAGTRHPALLVLAYAAAVLVWNYTLMDRFFIWALPLFWPGALA